MNKTTAIQKRGNEITDAEGDKWILFGMFYMTVKEKNPQNFGDVLMVDSDGGYFLFLNNI